MNPEDLLGFTTDDVNQVFEELKGLGVELDPDPLIFGPKRLNQKVAEVRKALGRTERLYLELSQRHHLIQRTLTMTNAEIEMAKKDLFANDPETRAGRSVSDREAIAYGKLRDQIVVMRSLELALQSIEAVLTAVKAMRSDLRDTQGRLRDQTRLCMEEISLGNTWGSKVPNASPLRPGATMAPSSVAEIDRLLGRVDGEINPGFGIDVEEDEEEGTGFTEEPPVIVDVGVIEPEASSESEPKSELKPEVTSVLIEEDEDSDDLSGLKDTSAESNLPPATADDESVYTFLDDLPEDLMGNSEGRPTAPEMNPDDDLSSILQSFEEIK